MTESVNMVRRAKLIPFIAAAVLLAPRPAVCQAGDDPMAAGSHATREELQAALEKYRLAAESDGYSGSLKRRARREASMIEERLEEGDFQPGDRVILIVENETALSDTFPVRGDRTIVLPRSAPFRSRASCARSSRRT